MTAAASRQSTLIALARQRWSSPSRRMATARDRARWCTITTASTTPSAGSQVMTVPEAERRPLRGLALDASGPRGEHDALRQVAVDVVGHPARELLEVARAGEHLDDAVGEVPQQRLGIGEFAAACGLTAEVLVVIVEELQGSTSRRGAAGGRACGHLGSMRGWRRPVGRTTESPPIGGRRVILE